MSNKIKDWTVLIYANGNNELEPEIWQSKLDAEKIGSTNKINIVMQISRESTELVKILRPYDKIPFTNEVWTGARRYFISKRSSILIDDLGKINMADHGSLYDFIVWGAKAYPAKKYMLIISGHGSSFIAVLPDLSQDQPYMMGVSEMCKVINLIKADIDINIDVLVLDICYMNIIEIIYELGKENNPTVKSLLTYIARGPVNGLPYDILTRALNQLPDYNEVDLLLKNIIEDIDLNLVAIEINHNKCKHIKELISKLAYLCLITNENENMSSSALLNLSNNNTLFNKYNKELKTLLSALVIHSKINMPTDSNPIEIIQREKYRNSNIGAFLPYYYKLSFARNNYWTYIISDKKLAQTININNPLLSIFPIAPDGLKRLVWAMNPTLSEEEINSIVDKTYTYKNWIK